MGTWGAGNLDSDYAFDEIHTRSAELINTMMKRARRKTSREGDEYDYTTLFVELEMVLALAARNLISGSCLPRPDDVEVLRKKWLQDWEAYMPALDPSGEHTRRRKAVIQRTFNRFIRLCRKHAED